MKVEATKEEIYEESLANERINELLGKGKLQSKKNLHKSMLE